MTKVFYYGGFLTAESIQKKYLSTIDKIIVGDFKQLKLENLEGHNVYSVQNNNEDRLLFAIIFHQNESSLIILDEILNDNFEQSRFLKPAFLRRFLDQDGIALRINTHKNFFKPIPQDSLPSISSSSSDIQLSRLSCFNQQFIEFASKPAQTAMTNQLPLIISAASCSASGFSLSLLEEYIENNLSQAIYPILYVTPHAHLATLLQEEWQQWPIAHTSAGRQVEFKSYLQLIYELDSQAASLKPVEKVFSKWLTEYIKEETLKQSNMDKQFIQLIEKRIDLVYHEFSLISTITLEDYLKLTQCQFQQEEQKKWLLQAYTHYKAHLKNNHYFHTPFASLKKTQHYHRIFVEHAQNFSLLQLKSLFELAIDHQIVFFEDTQQYINVNKLKIPSLQKISFIFPGHVNHIQSDNPDGSIVPQTLNSDITTYITTLINNPNEQSFHALMQRQDAINILFHTPIAPRMCLFNYLFFSFNSRKAFVPIINTYIDQLVPHVSYRALCNHALNHETPLNILALSVNGHNILQQLFSQNLSLARSIRAIDLARPALSEELAIPLGCTPLHGLLGNGEDILDILLKKNSTLCQEFTTKQLSRKLDKNRSSLQYLLAKENLAFLSRIINSLLSDITSTLLATPENMENDSPLFYLCLTEQGCKLLLYLFENNKKLSQDITLRDFCRVALTNVGYSYPFYWLSANHSGMKILGHLIKENSKIAQEITASLLANICNLSPQFDHVSSLYWLTQQDVGVEFLSKLVDLNPSVAQKLSVDILCKSLPQYTFEMNTSPLYNLCSIGKGMTLLKKLFQLNPSLQTSITMKDLCKPLSQSLYYKNATTLYWLCANPKRINFLEEWFIKNPTLIHSISATDIVRPIANGDFINTSVLYFLSLNEKGQNLLFNCLSTNPNLAQSIYIEDLTRATTDYTSPLLYLSLESSGIACLSLLMKQNVELALNISASDLTKSVSNLDNKHHNTTPLFWLLWSKAGLELLQLLYQQNPLLLKNISFADLTKECSHFNGTRINSALYILASGKDGIAFIKFLLTINPSLANEFSANILNKDYACPYGACKSNVFDELAREPEGHEVLTLILQHNPHFIDGFTTEMLCPTKENRTPPVERLLRSSNGKGFFIAIIEKNQHLLDFPSLKSYYNDLDLSSSAILVEQPLLSNSADTFFVPKPDSKPKEQNSHANHSSASLNKGVSQDE